MVLRASTFGEDEWDILRSLLRYAEMGTVTPEHAVFARRTPSSTLAVHSFSADGAVRYLDEVDEAEARNVLYWADRDAELTRGPVR